MRQDNISADLSSLAFCFFYRYSRMEFALKDCGYLTTSQVGSPANPDWYKFAEERHEDYCVTNEGERLISASPKRQVVAADKRLEWQSIDLGQCANDLERVIKTVKTIRNNLFHGGKHGGDGWHDPERTRMLLNLGVAVLDDIAKQTGLEADYSGH